MVRVGYCFFKNVWYNIINSGSAVLIDIKELQTIAVNTDNVVLTQHVLERIRQREVEKDDLLNIIATGEIIEQYPDDFPLPSCLILGNSIKGDPLHIVCGVGKNKLWIVTVYIPDRNEWESDLKTRKR